MTTKKRTFPLSAEELRGIADRVEKILTALGGEDLPDDDWRWGVSVEVLDEYGDVVGYIKPCRDGYLGFHPVEVSA